MYKGASRRTGGAALNGRAKIARIPTNAMIERAAAQTNFVRRLLLTFGLNCEEHIAKLDDYDLALLILKILDGYTKDPSIAHLEKDLQDKIEKDGANLWISSLQRRVTEATIPKILMRWERYRIQQD